MTTSAVVSAYHLIITRLWRMLRDEVSSGRDAGVDPAGIPVPIDLGAPSV